MNRRKAIFRHDALGNQDRILKVVAIPGHKGNQHVLAKRQFAFVGRRAVGHDVALRNYIAHAHQRSLVDVGILV